jgi:phosphoglycolate phosphatase
MNYKLIVFDWDGTLYDSVGHIIHTVRQAAEDLNMPVPTQEQARQVIGLNFEQALLTLFPETTSTQITTFEEHYRHLQKNSAHLRAGLFEGASDVLEYLKAQDYLLAIATGKGRSGLLSDLEDYQVARHFDAIRCGDDGPSKPDPQIMREILAEIGVLPQETVMIGDTTYDMLLAKNAGTDAIGVTYGVHNKEVLEPCGPKHFVHHVRELKDLF